MATATFDLKSELAKHGIELQQFTESEQACISGKISEAVGAGKEMDQAIAAAINQCAPEKSRSMADKLSSMLSTQITDLPGLKAKWIDNGDGTFDILDVPIMAELRKGEKGAPFDIDRAWHLKALKTNKQRESEGHVAPLKVHHPEIGTERPERAGFATLTRVGKVRMNGEIMSAIFANFRRVTAETFQKIKRVELPYRSVEANWLKFEIDAVALLDSDVPFHRMQMLTVAQAEKASVDRLADEHKPALAFCSLGDSPEKGVVLYKMGSIKMGDAIMAEHEENENENENGVEDRMTKMEDRMAGMEGTLQKIAEKLNLADHEDDEKKEENADESTPAELKADPTVIAELAATKSRLNKIEKKGETDTLIDGAKAELANYHLDEDSQKYLADMAAQGKDSLDKFVKLFKDKVEPETPETEDDFNIENATAALSADGQKIAKELGDTPEAVKMLKEQESEHLKYVQATGSTLSLENWVKARDYKAKIEEEANAQTA